MKNNTLLEFPQISISNLLSNKDPHGSFEINPEITPNHVNKEIMFHQVNALGIFKSSISLQDGEVFNSPCLKILNY